MKPHHAAALAFVGWCLIAPLPTWAQSETKKFTAPDRSLSFNYWEDLIDCEHKKQRVGGRGYYWPNECGAYHPVCDSLTDEEHQTSIACFAYPRNEFTNTKAFEAATFSVETLGSRTSERKCLAEDPGNGEEITGTTTINGISFTKFEFGDAGSSQYTSVVAYRTFHKGKCYQLGVDFAIAAAWAFDPPERELSDKDKREINGRLNQALKSFRFLK
jgi:hypothetical protein